MNAIVVSSQKEMEGDKSPRTTIEYETVFVSYHMDHYALMDVPRSGGVCVCYKPGLRRERFSETARQNGCPHWLGSWRNLVRMRRSAGT